MPTGKHCSPWVLRPGGFTPVSWLQQSYRENVCICDDRPCIYDEVGPLILCLPGTAAHPWGSVHLCEGGCQLNRVDDWPLNTECSHREMLTSGPTLCAAKEVRIRRITHVALGHAGKNVLTSEDATTCPSATLAWSCRHTTTWLNRRRDLRSHSTDRSLPSVSPGAAPI